MIDFENLNRIKKDLECRDILLVDKNDILLVILNWILKIDLTKIDMEKSKFINQDYLFELNLYSKNELNCNFFILIENNIIDIQLNYGGEYLYLCKIESKNDLLKLDEVMSDIMYNDIVEKLIYCNEKVIQSIYTVSHLIDDNIEKQDYILVMGNCFPWNKKTIVEKVYNSWISKKSELSYFR